MGLREQRTEALISPVSPAGNGVGCKQCSGERWSVITGALGREEVFQNRRQECCPLKELAISFLHPHPCCPPPSQIPPNSTTFLHGPLLWVPSTVNTVTEIRCGQSH